VASTSSSLSANPSSGNSYVADTVFGSGSSVGGGFVVFSGSAGGTNSVGNQFTVTGLANNTRYYFYIFEYDDPNFCYRQITSSVNVVTLPPPITSTYYYRSAASGAWNNKDNWEVSSNNSTWVPADLPPDTTANTITISTNDSIDIGSNVLADQIIVSGLLSHSNGVFRLNNGIGTDLNISATGRFKIQTPQGASFAYGTSFIISGFAIINVMGGSRIIIGNGAAVGAGFENLALAGSGTVTWNHNAVFEWNTITPFETEKVNYFPGASASVVPIFRVANVNNDFILGSDSTSVWNGLFEANGNVTFLGAGTKTFRNGIIGSGNLTQGSGCGTFRITGNPAQLGGSGSLILNGIAGDSIGVSTSVTPYVKATLISNKNIISGPTFILDTLDAAGFQISGNATTQITLSAIATPASKSGLIRTSSADGFYGNASSTVSSTIDSSKVNVRAGRVDHTASVSQTIMPYSYGDLFNSGNGPRTYSSAGEIRIAKAFSPGLGAATVAGSHIHYNGAIGQTIAGFTYNALSLSGSGTTKATDSLVNVSILDSMRVYAGVTLNLGYSGSSNSDTVFLRSSANQTARFARWEGMAMNYYANSKFVVERYISTPRKWQFLSVPTYNATAQSIRESWMEGNVSGGNNRPGYGTFVTSNDAQWSSKGFDAFSAGGPSVKYYRVSDSSYVPIDSAGFKINVNAASNSTAQGTMAKTAYFVYVRGDRSATPLNTVNNNTILRTAGRLVYNNTSVSNSITPGGKFYAIGNPYPSPVLFSALTKAFISNGFYIWDPKLSGAYGVGGFRTCSWDGSNYSITPYSPTTDTAGLFSGGVNNYIQSGQAFFVFNPDPSSNGTLTFTEASKAAVTKNVFRPSGGSVNRLRVNVMQYDAAGDPLLLDGCLINFSPAGNNRVDENDFRKLTNQSGNFAVTVDGVSLAAEDRKNPVLKDSIQFSQSGFYAGKYSLEVNAAEWDLGARLTAFMVDRYTAVKTPIQAGEMQYIDFTVNADPLSYAANRFYVIFRMTGGSQRDTTEAMLANEAPDKNNESVKFDIFPNPPGPERIIHFDLPLKCESFMLDILDAKGTIVFSKSYSSGNQSGSLQLPATLSSGMYSLRVSCESSKRTFCSRLFIP
jgi:hypothetical protein